MKNIEDRILRLEVVLGLTPAPEEWIPLKKVKAVQSCGYSLQQSKQILERNFGEIPDSIKWYVDLDSSEEHY